MVNPAAMTRMAFALGVAALACGCSANRPNAAKLATHPPVMATDPAFACPWLDTEHDRRPAQLAAAPAVPAGSFVPGCAIIRFTVAADGSVAGAALRAANPLNDGPTALASLRQMRFQPERKPKTRFVIRLDMKKDRAGQISVRTQLRAGSPFFGEES